MLFLAIGRHHTASERRLDQLFRLRRQAHFVGRNKVWAYENRPTECGESLFCRFDLSCQYCLLQIVETRAESFYFSPRMVTRLKLTAIPSQPSARDVRLAAGMTSTVDVTTGERG
ncbi:hypothetical protein NXC14_PA00040 (plasmid) [Rhizobium sp. NXC14]|uniref:hypothetical protein n=1 Tax=Rhizobium sp. NXC14 TaxID=1981173 RepID=UPI000A20298F|nr:hypothetical protein [Rhizobium sp. NXC14]ARO32337.1 hypothetical protein NXC14_PA00040 [Rhizobium sp. NXC14]